MDMIYGGISQELIVEEGDEVIVFAGAALMIFGALLPKQ